MTASLTLQPELTKRAELQHRRIKLIGTLGAA